MRSAACYQVILDGTPCRSSGNCSSKRALGN